MPKVSDAQLKMYFEGAASTYPLFTESVKLYDGLRIHADGEFPRDMITKRRPSETEEILAYREWTYKAITKEPMSKVITSFSKIRRSPDWVIDFPADKVPARIVEAETLEQYCNFNLPGYTSITNWLFGLLLKQNLIDANAVVAVIPMDQITQNEYAKPVPIVFNSNQIVDFSESKKYAILRSKRQASYDLGNGQFSSSDIFYYIDDIELIVYVPTAQGYVVEFQQANVTGEFPVFKLRAEAYKQYDNMSLNRSRLDAMVPFLDEAACEYSDLKGSKIQHLFPLFWYYENTACALCTGTGKIPPAPGSTGGVAICTACEGTGKIKFSPFAHLRIDPAGLGAQANPIPPAGYVTRDTDILDLQDKSVDKNLFKALGAVNMQFLDQTPLTISGKAKQVDREELNNTVYNFAEDLVYAADKAIYFINEWRNSFIVSDRKARQEMLPNIPVPQNFDLLPEDYLMKEVTDARTAKVNPLLIATLEYQLATKKFYNQPSLAENIKLYFDLDPLPGYTADEKMSLISNKAITQQDYVISTYIAAFIKRALREDDNYADKKYDQQMKVLTTYAEEKIKANDTASTIIDEQRQKILDEMNAGNGGQPGNANPADPNNPGNNTNPKAGFTVGETVMVKPGKEHMPEHKGINFTVAEVNGNTYALKLPDGSIHKWYTGDELMSMSNTNNSVNNKMKM